MAIFCERWLNVSPILHIQSTLLDGDGVFLLQNAGETLHEHSCISITEGLLCNGVIWLRAE